MEPVADAVRAPATRSENTSDGRAAYPLTAAREEGIRDRLIRPNVAKDNAVVCRSLARKLHDLAPGL